MEGDDEVNGPGRSYTTEFRQYDPVVGRWWGVDPLENHQRQIGMSPYSSFWNNPIKWNDQDGRCPSCVGFFVGVVVDYGLQVTENILLNDGNVTLEAFTKVNGTSIAMSGLAGATGAGLATKIKKASTLVKLGVELSSDGGASAINQFVNEGEVDLADVAIDAAAGQIIGKSVSNFVKGKVQGTDVGNALKRDADRAQRVAAQPKRSPDRQKAKQQKADEAFERSDTYGESRGAAAGSSSAGAASYVVQTVKEDENK
ncbi:MAG: hypothetical protein HUJ21_22055 [Cyclobacterium sp.]|nr:hypothetical protein [Cyclobacterium sp.]